MDFGSTFDNIHLLIKKRNSEPVGLFNKGNSSSFIYLACYFNAIIQAYFHSNIYFVKEILTLSIPSGIEADLTHREKVERIF